jgi:hypothetical protein
MVPEKLPLHWGPLCAYNSFGGITSMKQQSPALLSIFACLLAAPLVLAQPTIGGGSCSSSTVSGTYAIMITGRGVTQSVVTPAGLSTAVRPAVSATTTENLTKVFEAIGSATFDGQSKVNFTLAADTNTATNTTVTWGGTYSVQSNCAGIVTITTGGTATLNLALYNTGAALSFSGSDANYTYAGNGNTIATGCATSNLSGVYALTAPQGYSGVVSGNPGGAGSFTGIIQFDGQGNVIADVTVSANALLAGVTETQPGLTFTGTYSLGSNCVGSAKVSNSLIGTLDVNFSVYTATATLSTQMFISSAANPPGLMSAGNAYWIYALPAATPGAALHRGPRGLGDMLAKLFTGKSHKGEPV